MATIDSLLMSASCLYFGLLPSNLHRFLNICCYVARSVHVEVLQNICEMKVDCPPPLGILGWGTST